jgi:hypothetical protein
MVTGLESQDEFLHIGPDGSDQSDCLEFTAYDIPVRLGVLFRLHSRPGRGYTQLTACLYLPDGRAAFACERSGIGRESDFDGGGLRVEVVRPYQEVHVAYDGKVLLLEDPGAMLHPERPPAEHPLLDAEVHLTCTGISTLYEAGDDRRASGRGAPTEGRYEQLVSVFGSGRVGEAHWALDGRGRRAHRWGAPPSPEPVYRRRMTANIGPSFGFMACRVAVEGGGGSRGGFVWDGTALHVCRGITVKTSWGGGDRVPRAVDLTLKAGDQTWHAAGTVLSLLARPGDDGTDSCGGEGRQPATRTCEALTEWRLDDGQVGYGLSEYVDRVVDGTPAGVDE